MRFVWIGLAALALLAPAADAAPARRVALDAGLSVVLPHGWRLERTPITACSSPVDRLAAVTGKAQVRRGAVPPRSALVLVEEASAGPFPARPTRFTLPRLDERLGGCCEMPIGRGAELVFRDHGRRFYAFVYVGEHAPAGALHDAMLLLDSLRVATREAVAGA